MLLIIRWVYLGHHPTHFSGPTGLRQHVDGDLILRAARYIDANTADTVANAVTRARHLLKFLQGAEATELWKRVRGFSLDVHGFPTAVIPSEVLTREKVQKLMFAARSVHFQALVPLAAASKEFQVKLRVRCVPPHLSHQFRCTNISVLSPVGSYNIEYLDYVIGKWVMCFS